jgi:RNA polymerase sigma-70 factor, ECF subfamily
MTTTDTSGDGIRFAEAWRSNRSYLVDMAFGMLGNIAAAEDAVQESFTRLARARINEIEDVRGWLIVVTSRICLDQIKAAPTRREQLQETSAIESAPSLAPDPADRVTLDDEVRMALLVVLQRLTPTERVVFVLHDIFQLPFDSIAQTVGRPAATCRQLARRARVKLGAPDDARRGVAVDPAEHQQVAELFIRACADGDLDGLLGILDPEVWGGIDLGPLDRRSGQERRGADAVGANLLRYFRGVTMVSSPVGGHTIVLAFSGQKLIAIILLTVEARLVRSIDVLADPQKLAVLNAQLLAATPGRPDE